MNRTSAETAKDGGGRGLLIHSAGPLEQDALAGILRSASSARKARPLRADV
jgi:hypothetical protein